MTYNSSFFLILDSFFGKTVFFVPNSVHRSAKRSKYAEYAVENEAESVLRLIVRHDLPAALLSCEKVLLDLVRDR